MNDANSKVETIQALLSSITLKYKNEIDEINKNLVYKQWMFPNDYQKLLTIMDLKEKIEQYNLLEVDPRSTQEYIDMYNNNEWFRYFPSYNQNGKLIWHNTSDVLNIIEEFLKTKSKNNARNIYDYISNDNDRLNIIASAIVWNKLDYVARTANKYSYRPNLYDGIYEDGNMIGSLARNNKDESEEVICLSNILSTIKSFLSGKLSNDDILGVNAEALKACCNLQFNKIDIQNIKTILDFWNANIGKRFSVPFEQLSSTKELDKIKANQDKITQDIIDSVKLANFANSSISICNMSQSVTGTILSIGNSNIVKLSQTCTQTTNFEENVTANLSNVTNEFNEFKTEVTNEINSINNNVNTLETSSFPYITFNVASKSSNSIDELFNKVDEKVVISVGAIIAVIILALIIVSIFFLVKLSIKRNKAMRSNENL